MKISKIVITGGPCAGKSAATEWVRRAFSEKGYSVLCIPETATELITAGIAPWTCGSCKSYQTFQMKLQSEKESVFEQAARVMNTEKVLIVCDRGILDCKAYVTAEEFAQSLQFYGFDEAELLGNYDAVFHLVTAAKGAEAFYTTENNSARKETAEEAALLDEKLLRVWEKHPYLRVIGNDSSFEDKMKRLIDEIAMFLGEN